MHAWVREGVAAGAVGLSTGLIYEPGRYATTEEIVALARNLGETSGGLYATHIRNEADWTCPGFVDTWVKLPPLPVRAVARTLAD